MAIGEVNKGQSLQNKTFMFAVIVSLLLLFH